MSRKVKLTPQSFRPGDICIVVQNCGLTIRPEGDYSLGPNTKVVVAAVTEVAGLGITVSILNRSHKSYGKMFYLSAAELERGVLRKEQ